MNYIKQLNAFYKLIQVNVVSSNAQCLYNYLLSVNNELGWVERFTKSNFVICGATQLSRRTLDRVRNELKQKGLIEYEKGTSNQAGTYKIIPLYDETLSVSFGTQGGIECQIWHTDDTQDDTQMSHTVSTLNKQETKTIYLDFLNKVKEKKNELEKTSSHFGAVVLANGWAKTQPEYQELTPEEQSKLLVEV